MPNFMLLPYFSFSLCYIAQHSVVLLDGSLCMANDANKQFSNTVLVPAVRMYGYLNLTHSILLMFVVACKSLPPPENGYIVESTGRKVNDTVSINCTEGFMLSGSATRKCEMNGVWSGMPAQCTS